MHARNVSTKPIIRFMIKSLLRQAIQVPEPVSVYTNVQTAGIPKKSDIPFRKKQEHLLQVPDPHLGAAAVLLGLPEEAHRGAAAVRAAAVPEAAGKPAVLTRIIHRFIFLNPKNHINI